MQELKERYNKRICNRKKKRCGESLYLQSAKSQQAGAAMTTMRGSEDSEASARYWCCCLLSSPGGASDALSAAPTPTHPHLQPCMLWRSRLQLLERSFTLMSAARDTRCDMRHARADQDTNVRVVRLSRQRKNVGWGLGARRCKKVRKIKKKESSFSICLHTRTHT